jgi:voltage-gated potassium channel
MIYCAIATYFLIGTMWSGIYHILEGISPGSFSGISGTVDLIYFSFVCLTTLGFGDITPQSIIGKRLAIFEAAMGVIYSSVIIAIIVGRYMSKKENHSFENEKN